ncbi:hypothetical protein [Blastococcus sp. CT_GayMR16]|uniref:hypothetical protein n=1 Tax=Blastococcus sp. CT_GayMR16 TaxID=2559607 RepID=UPI001073408C|nr:hypothetical protein [Blastococcus sp. CT_GayMR16]TFV90592.1 hypothetical protein E4P38_04025 [Blastococcus sp. CT_GayMR16]
MTTAADDTTDEAAFEAFLAGRPLPEEADGGTSAVAAFAGAVRATATLPGRPNAALADLLASGLLTDQSSPSTRTAPSAGSSPRRSRVRRRRRFAMFFPALLAKLLSAGAVAQAATGAGVVLVAFTGAGATGVLGDNVQDTLSTVVGAADETTDDVTTPDETLTADETTTDPGEVEVPEVVTEVTVEAEFTPEEWAANGPVEGQKFSDWVHAAFPDGKADGQVVSHWARLKHVDLEEVDGIEDVEGIDDSDTNQPTAEVEAETEDAGEDSRGNGNGHGGHGNGNGNGNGRGHN